MDDKTACIICRRHETAGLASCLEKQRSSMKKGGNSRDK